MLKFATVESGKRCAQRPAPGAESRGLDLLQVAVPLRRRVSRLALLLAIFAITPAFAAGDETAPKAGERDNSLDDELLEGLGGDDVEGLVEPEKANQPAKDSSGDDELLRGLGDVEDVKLDGPQDPLSKISGRMREVEQLIAEADAGEGTQGKQREIASEMDKLIRDLQKQCQACKQGSSKRQKSAGRGKVGQPDQAKQPSDQAARDSSDRLNEKKTEKPDAAAMGEMVKAAWGHLPEHMRPEMEQLPTLEFLPEYLLLIEDYFKALAKPSERDRR